MIEAKDLRIGNWVAILEVPKKKYYHQVTSHDITEIEKAPESVDPIVLTGDILIKAGFKRLWDGSIQIWRDNNGVKLWHDDQGFYHINSELITYIDHVHFLQNCYFFNTKEELNIEL